MQLLVSYISIKLYIPDDLSWRQTYIVNMRPVIFTPMPGDLEIQAPLTRVPRGALSEREVPT